MKNKPIEQHICCICHKLIKKRTKLVYIGKNNAGLVLYRHQSCYLFNINDQELNNIKNATKIEIRKKQKRK